MIPAEVRDQRAIESARFVRAKFAGRRGVDLDDVFQEAVLWALEWAERYGSGCKGNPFTPMVGVGLRRATLAAKRARHISSITEHGLRTEWPIWSPVQIADCGGQEEEGAVQLADDDGDGGEVHVSGEPARRRRVARLLADLDPAEQRLLGAALGASPPSLRAMAEQCGLSRNHARRVLRRLATALGEDPMARAARVRSLDQRLPKPGTILRRRVGDRDLECRITTDGLFEYAGRRYRSLSAAAFDASRDAGRPRVAINGFEFWGLLGSPRVVSGAWKRRKGAVGSRPSRKPATCTPSTTAPSLKLRKQSAARHRPSTSASTAAASRR